MNTTLCSGNETRPSYWGHLHFHQPFIWWAIKSFVGWADNTREESDDVVDMLCMGNEL